MNESVIELAGTLIIQEKGLLLLYREDEEHWESQHSQGESCSTSNPKGYWDVPGGKVKEDESPTQAAVREASEEIGVEVELEKPFFSGEFEHDGELFLWHGYIADTDDEPSLQDADCSCEESACSSNPEDCCEEKFSELKWFDAEMLDEEDLAPNVRQIEPALRRVLKAKE